MSRLITITSGKGGVGKTTTTINLGAALTSFGKRVIVVDANLSTPNVGLHLGAPIVPISLNHVLQGKATIGEAMYEHHTGTKIIPSSLSIQDMRQLPHHKLKEVGKKLRKMADIVLFDCAAGLGDEAFAALDAADEIVIVTNPELPAVTDALKTAKLIETMGKHVHGVIVTRVAHAKTEMPIANIADMLELPILGVIPDDNRVKQALVAKNALVDEYPHSKSARAYKRIAAHLIGDRDYRDQSSLLQRMFG